MRPTGDKSYVTEQVIGMTRGAVGGDIAPVYRHGESPMTLTLLQVLSTFSASCPSILACIWSSFRRSGSLSVIAISLY